MQKNHYHDKDLNLDLTDAEIKRRNRDVEKYMPLVNKIAYERNDPNDTTYTVAELQSALFEALTISCGKHLRRKEDAGIKKVHISVYLKQRLEGAAKDFISREAPIHKGTQFVSLDEEVKSLSEEGEPMTRHDIVSDGWDVDGLEHRATEVTANIERHLTTIREAVEALTLKQRYVIKCTQNGRTQQYIADKLGITREAVHHIQQRSYVALRQQLEKRGLNSDDFFL